MPRRHNGIPYRGINVLILWAEAIDRGYNQSLWMTYRQALELGAHVRHGEHGTTVIYADRIVGGTPPTPAKNSSARSRS